MLVVSVSILKILDYKVNSRVSSEITAWSHGHISWKKWKHGTCRVQIFPEARQPQLGPCRDLNKNKSNSLVLVLALDMCTLFFSLLKTRISYFLSISQNLVVSWCCQSIDCTITKLYMSHVCASCNLNRIWSSTHTALRSRVLAGRSRAVAICVICRAHADQQVAAALTASNTCLITRRPPVC